MTLPPATALRHEVFVYYRAEPAQAEVLALAARRMQSALCATHAGLSARLLRRPDLREGQHTWMEAYRLPDGADVLAVAAAIEAAAQSLQAWILGPRHVEHFVECAS